MLQGPRKQKSIDRAISLIFIALIYSPTYAAWMYYFGSVVVVYKFNNTKRYAKILVGHLPDLPHRFCRPCGVTCIQWSQTQEWIPNFHVSDLLQLQQQIGNSHNSLAVVSVHSNTHILIMWWNLKLHGLKNEHIPVPWCRCQHLYTQSYTLMDILSLQQILNIQLFKVNKQHGGFVWTFFFY